jgi:uncharacterized protein YkwD
MNIRLKETFAFVLTIIVTFISFFGAVPAQAQTNMSGLTKGGIIALANIDRYAYGEHKVVEDPLLDYAAQLKANDMAAKGYFSHVDPSGNAPWMWFKKVGYYYWSAGENLAVNFNDSLAVNSAWMNSPTHRANLLTSSYSRMGIGIAHGTYLGKPATFIVQFFANPYIGAGSKVAVL